MPSHKEKRSLRNIAKTSKYHFAYLGNVLFVSLGLILLLYVMILERIVVMTQGGPPESVRDLMIGSTLGAALLGATVTFVCILTSHRIAGVHVKLKNTFRRIREGDIDHRLAFRKEDKLEEVEQEFNEMMDVLRHRIKAQDQVQEAVQDQAQAQEAKPEEAPEG